MAAHARLQLSNYRAGIVQSDLSTLDSNPVRLARKTSVHLWRGTRVQTVLPRNWQGFHKTEMTSSPHLGARHLAFQPLSSLALQEPWKNHHRHLHVAAQAANASVSHLSSWPNNHVAPRTHRSYNYTT